jgi:hypothetical protein
MRKRLIISLKTDYFCKLTPYRLVLPLFSVKKGKTCILCNILAHNLDQLPITQVALFRDPFLTEHLELFGDLQQNINIF